MQELVELIRRDHAELDALATELDRPGRGRGALTALRPLLTGHLALLDAVIGPSVGERSPAAAREWETARADLVAADDAARRLDGHDDSADARAGGDRDPGSGAAAEALRSEVRDHLAGAAEQLEQVVLPRLLDEVGEAELGDEALAMMRAHEALVPLDDGPHGIHARVADDERHPSRPAGSE